MVPKGDAVEEASLANPELAKAEADVCCGLSSFLSDVAEGAVSLLSDGLSAPGWPDELAGRESWFRQQANRNINMHMV